jgi:hypothetical protein
MNTYHFVAFLVHERVRDARRTAEEAHLTALAEQARLPVRRESILRKIRHFLRGVPGITSDRRYESPDDGRGSPSLVVPPSLEPHRIRR